MCCISPISLHSVHCLYMSGWQMGASSEHRVTLTNVTAATAGNYSCEAMSDAPDFFVSGLSVYIPVLGEYSPEYSLQNICA